MDVNQPRIELIVKMQKRSWEGSGGGVSVKNKELKLL